MKKGIAFSGSNSSTSINKQLLLSVLQYNEAAGIEFVNIQDWDIPMFSEDREKKGYPPQLMAFQQQLKEAAFILVGTNEHNRNVSAFFKNILDWISRINFTTFENKKIGILSSSNGYLGGAAANDYLHVYFSRGKAEEIFQQRFPSFYENFDTSTQKISNEDLETAIKNQLLALKS